MSHREQLEFVSECMNYFRNNNIPRNKILEIGSYSVNGSIREIFKGAEEYIGVDLTAGPGVDFISTGIEIGIEDRDFDLAISCECFEHNPYWDLSFFEMYLALKVGGVLIVSCASPGRLEHGTSRTSISDSPGTNDLKWDYYRNLSKSDFLRRFPMEDLFSNFFFEENGVKHDLYFVGVKKNINNVSNEIELRDLQSSIKKMIWVHCNSYTSSWIGRTFYTVSRIPLKSYYILPDRLFQSFAIRYARLIDKIYAVLKKLF